MRIETLSYQINWRNFKKGYSFFVPCINVVAAREEISRVTCRLKIEVITKVVIEEGVKGKKHKRESDIRNMVIKKEERGG